MTRPVFAWSATSAVAERPAHGNGGGAIRSVLVILALVVGLFATPAPPTAAAQPPSLILILSANPVTDQDAFTLRLESSSPVGVDLMWWWATSTDDADLQNTHIDNCHGSSPCRQSWPISSVDSLAIVFHGKFRD